MENDMEKMFCGLAIAVMLCGCAQPPANQGKVVQTEEITLPSRTIEARNRMAPISKDEKIQQRPLSEINQSSKNSGKSTSLADSSPSQISSKMLFDSGSDSMSDWYIGGLREYTKKNPSTKAKILNLLSGRRVFDYDVSSLNQFEKEDFSNEMKEELRQFVDRIYSHPIRPVPRYSTSFTFVKLGQFNSNGMLDLQICRGVELSLLSCGSNSDGADGFNNDLNGVMRSITAAGKMVASKGLRPKVFQYQTGGGDNGAPSYVLNAGALGSLKVKLSREQARSLFEVAKTTSKSSSINQPGNLKGQILSAKIRYRIPSVKSVEIISKTASSTSSYSYPYGLVVSYGTFIPIEICLLDGAGEKLLLCTAGVS
jgi:hypothetical protein